MTMHNQLLFVITTAEHVTAIDVDKQTSNKTNYS